MIYINLKRIADIFFSLILIVIVSPIIFIISILIKLNSRGPIFYKAHRSGMNGELFYILKFRTMYLNANTAKMTTSSNDDRITSLGFYLRKYKIDELPQLINVLMGHMSIVGPRPELPYYTKMYSKKEKTILSVRPGITDFASVEFYNLNNLIPDNDSNNFFEKNILKKKNRLRLKYVNEISFLTDCKIFFFTMIKLFKVIINK